MADNVEIQGLEFQIIGDSVNAEDSLTKLKETLVALKTAVKGGVSGVRTTAKQITALNTALDGLDTSATNKLVDLAAALKPLSEIGRAHLTSLINQLGKLFCAGTSDQSHIRSLLFQCQEFPRIDTLHTHFSSPLFCNHFCIPIHRDERNSFNQF